MLVHAINFIEGELGFSGRREALFSKFDNKYRINNLTIKQTILLSLFWQWHIMKLLTFTFRENISRGTSHSLLLSPPYSPHPPAVLLTDYLRIREIVPNNCNHFNESSAMTLSGVSSGSQAKGVVGGWLPTAGCCWLVVCCKTHQEPHNCIHKINTKPRTTENFTFKWMDVCLSVRPSIFGSCL